MALLSLPPSGVVLSFDEKSYTFEDNSVKVRVRSSRPLPGSSLRDLVILNIVGLPPKNSATSATSDTSMFEIKGGLMDVITYIYIHVHV